MKNTEFRELVNKLHNDTKNLLSEFIDNAKFLYISEDDICAQLMNLFLHAIPSTFYTFMSEEEAIKLIYTFADYLKKIKIKDITLH